MDNHKRDRTPVLLNWKLIHIATEKVWLCSGLTASKVWTLKHRHGTLQMCTTQQEDLL